MKTYLIPILVMGATAARIDFGAYVRARSEDPNVAFDYKLCLFRVLEGMLGGFLTGAGLTALNG